MVGLALFWSEGETVSTNIVDRPDGEPSDWAFVMDVFVRLGGQTIDQIGNIKTKDRTCSSKCKDWPKDVVNIRRRHAILL